MRLVWHDHAVRCSRESRLVATGLCLWLALLLAVPAIAAESQTTALETTAGTAQVGSEAVVDNQPVEEQPGLELNKALPALAAWIDSFSLPWRKRPDVEPATPPAPPEPEPEPEPVAPPVVYHQRVLLVGECNIEGGLGPLLQTQLEAVPGVTVKRYGKRSTGLARPDYYDWPARIRQLKDEFQPDLIVAYWGDNDCQSCLSPKGKSVAAWGSAEAWHAEYARRAAEAVALMREGGAEAVVVGMPNMRPEKFRKGIARVNSALAEGCAQSGGVFIDAWLFNTGADGAYLSQVEYGGKTRTFQGDDGIHFTSHGAKFMAARIFGELTARFAFGEAPEAVADGKGEESGDVEGNKGTDT